MKAPSNSSITKKTPAEGQTAKPVVPRAGVDYFFAFGHYLMISESKAENRNYIKRKNIGCRQPVKNA